MDILIEFLPADTLRYKTAGDWFVRDGTLHIQVAKTDHDVFDQIIAVHEFVEWLVCNHQGVTEQAVDEWDFSHTDSRDPGDEDGCPYADAHNLATVIERLITTHLRIPWKQYDDTVLGAAE